MSLPHADDTGRPGDPRPGTGHMAAFSTGAVGLDDLARELATLG